MDLYSYDQSLSTVNKVQREYWMAKQVLKKKFGKEEDQHVVAGDTDIDCKLAQYESIQSTCARLLKELEKYHSCICLLARDENSLGRFLKDQGSHDSTRAGKMMIAVGKALCYSAQQRLQLRHPMGRFREDIETFRQRAIADTSMSVKRMEEERTHYRASLLWMRDISATLDPEQYRKLEKFKKVQNEVRINKQKFDHQKWDVCQKIDLLSASRTNLFSNTLVPYQNELLNFWEKTARNMAAVLESFKGYQHYEFKLLKDLNPIQLADKAETEEKVREVKDEGDDDDALINFENQDADEFGENPFEEAMDALGLEDDQSSPQDTNGADQPTNSTDASRDASNDASKNENEEIDLWNDLMGGDEQGGKGEFEDQWKSAFGEFVTASPGPGMDGPESQSQIEKDMLSLLKPAERSSQVPQPGGDDFKGFMPSQLLDMHFMHSTGPPSQGQMPMPPAYHSLSGFPPMNQNMPAPGQQAMMLTGMPNSNMPGMYGYNMSGIPFQAGSALPQHQPQAKSNVAAQRPPSKDSSKGKADWYNLFAELDPLQNPDALGKKETGKNDEDGRAC